MCTRRRHNRIATWLAAVAIGLLMLAPTVSRTLLASSPGACMDMGPVTAGTSGHTAGSRSHQPKAPATPSTDACGYCSLLYHTPAMASAAVPLPAAMQATFSVPWWRRPGAPFHPVPDRRSRSPPFA